MSTSILPYKFTKHCIITKIHFRGSVPREKEKACITVNGKITILSVALGRPQGAIRAFRTWQREKREASLKFCEYRYPFSAFQCGRTFSLNIEANDLH